MKYTRILATFTNARLVSGCFRTTTVETNLKLKRLTNTNRSRLQHLELTTVFSPPTKKSEQTNILLKRRHFWGFAGEKDLMV